MTVTILFRTSEKMGEIIEELVKSGNFQNQNEVITACIQLLEEQAIISKLQQLHQLIDESDNSRTSKYDVPDIF